MYSSSKKVRTHLRSTRHGFTSHKTDLRHSSCENLHSNAHRKLRDKKVPDRFQAPTAVQLRPSLFWDVTRRNIPEERRTQQGDPFGNKKCSQLLKKLRLDLLHKNYKGRVKHLTDWSKEARLYSYNESQRDALFLIFI
jgi:hypothetical protein